MAFTRYRGWFLIGGFIAILAIAAGVAVYLSRKPKLDAKAMLSYMPPRDAATLYIDVAAARISGVLDKVAGAAGAEEPEYKTFVAQSGFNYRTDLDCVLVSSADTTHYILLEGRFDWDKLRQYATSQGGSCEGDFCSTKASTPDRTVSFQRLEKNVMALASAPNGRAAKEINRTTRQPGFEIPDKPVWLDVPVSYLQKQQDLPSGTRLFARALEGSQRALFTLGPSAGKLELAMDVTCTSPEAAATLRAQLEGITKLLQSLIAREKQSPSGKDLSGLLTSGSFQRNAEHVVGRWQIERSFLDSLGGS